MIRINLLESITDKPTSAAVIVEKKVSNPVNRFYLLAGVCAALLVLAIGFDYIWATSTKSAADSEFAEQQRIAKELEAVTKEMEDLKAKTKDMDDRITAIKTLRGNQGGPSSVLQAVSERIGNAPGLYLESVEQKGEILTIKGNSPNEYTVSNFGRSLEFSSGLFSNLNIETARKELDANQVQSSDGKPVQLNSDPDAPKTETVNFTIKCSYTPSKGDQAPLPGAPPTATKAQSSNSAAPANGTQMAKN